MAERYRGPMKEEDAHLDCGMIQHLLPGCVEGLFPAPRLIALFG